MASGAFLPTTDELCNLARGVDTRNVQLDPRTKNRSDATIKGCSVLTSALLTLCVCLPSVSRPHLLFAQKAALFPSTLTFGFRQKVRHTQSSYFVKLISSAACGEGWGVWGRVAVQQLETQLTVTDLRRRIRNQSFNRIYIDQGVVECISPIQDNGVEID